MPEHAPPAPSRDYRTQYLIVYNVASTFLWFVVLARVSLLAPLVGSQHVYSVVGSFVKWTQSLAVLEIVYAQERLPLRV